MRNCWIHYSRIKIAAFPLILCNLLSDCYRWWLGLCSSLLLNIDFVFLQLSAMHSFSSWVGTGFGEKMFLRPHLRGLGGFSQSVLLCIYIIKLRLCILASFSPYPWYWMYLFCSIAPLFSLCHTVIQGSMEVQVSVQDWIATQSLVSNKKNCCLERA